MLTGRDLRCEKTSRRHSSQRQKQGNCIRNSGNDTLPATVQTGRRDFLSPVAGILSRILQQFWNKTPWSQTLLGKAFLLARHRHNTAVIHVTHSVIFQNNQLPPLLNRANKTKTLPYFIFRMSAKPSTRGQCISRRMRDCARTMFSVYIHMFQKIVGHGYLPKSFFRSYYSLMHARHTNGPCTFAVDC